MFEPITTERLIIRSMGAGDGESLWRRRNDPEVARYQDWSTPFPRDSADRIAASSGEMGGPQPGEWWMAAVDLADGGTVGDLAVHLDEHGHAAEIGYTLERAHWRRGYAVEAASALIDHLFDSVGVVRVFGMLHPDNRASAMVLERCGMLFEGHTRLSFSLDGEASDDWIYGMTRDDREAWRSRPTRPPAEVRLVEITPDNLRATVMLRTHRSQEAFVAPMGRSLAQALVPGTTRDGLPITPWYRAVEADGTVVGFVMVALVEGRDPYLWRMLIDRMHQRRGIGGRAIELLEEEARRLGAEYLLVSFGEGRGSPRDAYLGWGFEVVAMEEGEETEARKRL